MRLPQYKQCGCQVETLGKTPQTQAISTAEKRPKGELLGGD